MWIRYLPDRVYAAVMDVAADDSPQQPLQQEPQQPLQQEPLAPEQLPVQQGHYAHEGKRLGEHQEQWRVDADSGVLQHALQRQHDDPFTRLLDAGLAHVVSYMSCLYV
jgi:hypothetical protein